MRGLCERGLVEEVDLTLFVTGMWLYRGGLGASADAEGDTPFLNATLVECGVIEAEADTDKGCLTASTGTHASGR